MITKLALFEQYCIIEEIIEELNHTLYRHLQGFSHGKKFKPSSCFIAHVIMVHHMMLHFIQSVERFEWMEEFHPLLDRTKRHLTTTEMMLEDLIHP